VFYATANPGLAGRTIVQTTKPSPEALAYLEKLKISRPKKILSVTDSPSESSEA